MPDFMIYALMGGLGVAAISGPLGCFVVWRRMAYFGDTLAHSALMGIALGLLLDINMNIAITMVCIFIATALVVLLKQRQLASDTLLGILAHSSLSIGLVVVSFIEEVRIDLTGYLFGDLLAISPADLAWIYGGAIVVGLLLAIIWKSLLMMTIHEELAKVEGLPVDWLRLILMLLFSIVIAVAMKIVGVLLITAMLIIPAATARRVSNTPESMAINASLLGMLSVILGLTLSYFSDTPAGPSVVVSAFALFTLIYLAKPQKS
ncbi:zinc ABC transporter permease subunit ZnuB [Alkalimarinus coralli]|uniref:zinc ABC transporter permease subunit ZnuB n=1 Tax=Alkalimarinus coralli TaxID=2935863 RepID=UPI00202B12B8|nr:zinc ABC transporter permease subunit ZnuB [Alkalimarinus coralli]